VERQPVAEARPGLHEHRPEELVLERGVDVHAAPEERVDRVQTLVGLPEPADAQGHERIGREVVEDDRALRREGRQRAGLEPVLQLGELQRVERQEILVVRGVDEPDREADRGPVGDDGDLADLLDAVLRDVVVEDSDEALEADDVMRDVVGVERVEEEAGRAAIARRIGRHEVEDVVADARSLRERVIQ